MPPDLVQIEPRGSRARAEDPSDVRAEAPSDARAGAPSDPESDDASPEVPLAALDQLWFQVAGTVCNLRCRHCFISCSPENHSFRFMGREAVREHLEASVELGVKEYYFTGGEPFMNRDLPGILEDALGLGPATVLTNGTLLPPRAVDEVTRIAAASPYTLELRVSVDGTTAAMNDAIRGEGTFERALEGIERLVQAGFLPIVTCMRTWEEEESPRVLEDFRRLLGGIGYDRPRIKVMPPLLIGEEARRTRGYTGTERVTREMLRGFDLDELLCRRARLVTAQGVWACPILLDSPGARVGDDLQEAVATPARLSERACFTCYMSGSICANMPASGEDR